MPIIEAKHNPYSNAILILVVSVLVVLGLIFFLILPLNKELSANKSLLAEKKNSSSAIESQSNQAKQSFASLAKNQSTLQRINLALPTKPNVPDIQAHLETLAQVSNVTLKMINLTDPTQPKSSGDQVAPPVTSGQGTDINVDPAIPGLKVMPINIELSGGYADLTRFLDNLEESLTLFDVKKIDVMADETADKLRFSLFLNTYYYSVQ